MTLNTQMKISCAAVIGVIAILAFASIGSAYSYSSSVTSDGNTITAQYLTINVFNGAYNDQDGKQESSEVVITVEGVIDSKKMIKDSVEATPAEDYSVRVSSNGLTQAYVYGYYTCTTDAGVAVEYIEIQFTDGSTANLVRDAYKCGLTASTTKADTLANLSGTTPTGVHYKDYQIQTITVHYYSGLTTTGGNISVSHGTASGITGTTTEAALLATSLSEFQFHFLTSRSSLINA